MGKHTPGPWEISAEPRNRIQGRKGISVAYVTVIHPTAENEANARLIAAAPELLAEMKRYLPVLQALESKPSAWEWYTDSIGIATLNGYRNAIAKAEGQSND